MAIEYRYANDGDYPRIGRFFEQYWAKNYVYVRMPELFEWTFRRDELWDRSGYSFALAEKAGEIVGILGGIPFALNALGRAGRAVWLANLMVRPEDRRGPTAVRLLAMFQRPPFEAVIAFRVSTQALPFYRLLRWNIVDDIPRHFAVLPDATERLTRLLEKAYPDWPQKRARELAQAFRCTATGPPASGSAGEPPDDWDAAGWSHWTAQTVGAARDLAYLRWRYCSHPRFEHRFLALRQGRRWGLLVWRLEPIRLAEGPAIDRIARVLELLPVSAENGQALLASFFREAAEAGALGADFYGYHGAIRNWLDEAGFQQITVHRDGGALPSRFQPLDSKGGRIPSAIALADSVPKCSLRPDCPWYWTKSDGDQDRPN